MSTAQRSKTGCWTCRLRRKKCNEGGPPCANCEARGVFCHGYGPKPPWKDRGEKEKEQASMLRLQPRQRLNRPKNLSDRTPQQCAARNTPIDESNCNRDTTVPPRGHSPSQSDLSLSSLSSSQDRQAVGLLSDLDILGSWDAPESSNNDLWLGSSSAEALIGFNDVQAPTEELRPDSWVGSVSSNELLVNLSPAETLVGISGVRSPTQAGSLQSNNLDNAIGFSSGSWPGPSSAQAPSTLAESQPPLGDQRPDPLDSANGCRPSSTETLDTSTHVQPPIRYPRPSSAICFPIAAAAQVSDFDEREIELVMHFIGETFALQHTSYRAASNMQRSWLLLLLMRSPTFYYASLSMSAYHYYISLSSESEVRISTFQAYQKYRTWALSEFYKLLKPDQPSTFSSDCVLGESMICGVQIALLEVRTIKDSFLGLIRRLLSNACLGP